MDRKKLITVLSLGALVVALAVGAVAYRSATAAAAAPTAANNNSLSPMDRGLGGGFRNGPAGNYTNEDLANALGITVDELNTAYQNANAAALKQAVEQGLITQAQADQLSANGSAFPFGGRWDGWLSQNGVDYNALLAEALGISVDKLQAAYTQAYNARIDQAVTDGNLTQAQADLMKGQRALYADKNFQSSMQTAFESAVNQAVTNGVITQAQADQILQNQASVGFGSLRDFGGLPGFGPSDGGRGFGPHNGFGGGSNQTAPATPTATP